MDSTNKKILLITDIHLDTWRADKILNREAADHVFILGDIFDQFDDNAKQNRNAANWIKPKLHDKNFTVLWGNHDLSYRYPLCRCSGYQTDKEEAINSVLTKDDWAKFVWFDTVDDILLTHAGLHPSFIPKPATTLQDVTQWLGKETQDALEYLGHNGLKCKHARWAFKAGYSRGGTQPFGGIVWLDDDEFVPIPFIKQIFGHSYGHRPRKWLNDDQTVNSICFDSNLKYYITITNKQLEIKNIYDA